MRERIIEIHPAAKADEANVQAEVRRRQGHTVTLEELKELTVIDAAGSGPPRVVMRSDVLVLDARK